MRIPVLVFVPLILVGCVQFPAIDDATSQVARDADYPDLVPLEPISDVLAGADEETLETEKELETRVKRLNARANRLRKPVLDAEDRARLAETPL